MKIPHEKFCILPWVSLEASPIGTVRPCCLALDEIRDDQGQRMRLAHQSFDDIQNSKHMRELRQQFLDQKQPQTCHRCWQEEYAGRTSKRMHTLDRLKHMDMGHEWTADAKPLRFVDLKLGNICNLKCRICGSWSSSTFATEELHFVIGPEAKKQSYHYQMLREGAWPRDNENFWREIDQAADHIRYIEFTGGEPFMIDQHFDLLQSLVDRGISQQVEIHYNTNGTIVPERAMHIWPHFGVVEIAFSIDDLGARFEYQRTNADWNLVQKNIQHFQQLRAQMPNLRLQCCSTVNVFNIRYIDQLAHWISQQNFDFVYWNMMHDSWYFSIATLPDPVKQALTVHLQQASVPPRFRDEFDRIVSFMNGGASTDGTVMIMKIQDLDRKRDQSLLLVEPEFAKLIGYDSH